MVFMGNVNNIFGGWLVVWFMERGGMASKESYKKDDGDDIRDGDKESYNFLFKLMKLHGFNFSVLRMVC